MKSTLIFLCALLTVSLLQAQASGILSVDPAEVNKDIVVDNLDENFEDVTSIVVTNNSTRTIRLLREAVTKRQPRSWSFTTLDRLSRAAPYVMSSSEQDNGRQIPLAPGQSATFYVVLRPDGVAGSGSTELRFSDLTVPGKVLATASISTQLTQRPSATTPETPPQEETRPLPTTVRLYPNPAPERFFVESPRGTSIGRVEVTNTLGRQIKSFGADPNGNGYDIKSLPDGLYLISIYDERGKKLKTLRLLHRQSGGA